MEDDPVVSFLSRHHDRSMEKETGYRDRLLLLHPAGYHPASSRFITQAASLRQRIKRSSSRFDVICVLFCKVDGNSLLLDIA